MRLAYITGEYPRATDTFIQRDIAALRRQGAEVFSFSIRKTDDKHMVGREQREERARTFYVLAAANPIALLLAQVILFFQSPARYIRAVALALELRQAGMKGSLYSLFYFLEAGILARQVQKQKIDHLHNHIADSNGNVTLLAAALSGRSFSFSIQGPMIFFEAVHWRLNVKFREALFVRCISHFCRSQCMIFTPPEQWHKLHLIHCGVEPELFESVSHPANRQNLIFVGRLAAVKGVPILLESMAQLKQTNPNARLTLVGDGPERPTLEKMALELGVTDVVDFVGYKSQSEVRDYLQRSDVFVLPTFAEGLPIVFMEALAAGVPVVSTQIAGHSDLVEQGKSGYLVSPGDKTSLTAALKTLLDSPELRRQFATAGREKIRTEFDIDHEVGLLFQVMKMRLQGGRPEIRPTKAMSGRSSEAERPTPIATQIAA
ncbi:MAG: glycosyltransferase [Cyanobacteria bacterium J06632_22]